MAVTVLFVLSLCVLFCAIYFYYKYVYILNKNLKRLPCPPEIPFLGHALDFMSGTGHLEVLLDYVKNFGDIVRIKTGPTRQFLLVSDYNFCKFILADAKVLKKSIDYKYFYRWLGTGLITADKQKWKKHRQIISPAYHYNVLKSFADVFESNAKILVQQLEKEVNKPSINIQPLISLCTLDIICETTMGTSMKAQENKESEYVSSVKEMLSITIERSFSPYKMFDWIYFFTEDYKRETKALKVIHSYTWDSIQKRLEVSKQLNKQGNNKSLLNHLLDGHHLTLNEIREEVDTFVFAGHDPTAAAIGFSLYCLSEHPEVQTQVCQEQTEIFGKDKSYSTTLQDLKNMKYLEMVIKESLRLYPPGALFARELDQDICYGGLTLPKGLSVTIFIFALHRNSKFFPNPDKFDPNRFANFDNQAFLPFGTGPRTCIGQGFAMAEIKSVVSNIVRNFELLPSTPRHELKLASRVVLTSTNGICLRLKRKSN